MLTGRKTFKVGYNHLRRQAQQRSQLLGAVTFGVLVSGWLIFQLSFQTPTFGAPDAALSEESSVSRVLSLPDSLENSRARQLVKHFVSPRDLKLYYSAFLLQDAGNMEDARILLSQTSDPLLKGHVEANFLLDKTATPSQAEFEAWLDTHSALPQALEVNARYRKLFGKAAQTYPLAVTKPIRRNFTDSVTPRDVIRSGDKGAWAQVQNAYIDRDYATSYRLASQLAQQGKAQNASAYWTAGISAWHLGNYQAAASYFSQLDAYQNQISRQLSSAGAFWAYRAQLKNGNGGEALSSLRSAARYPDTFYGLLANTQLNSLHWQDSLSPKTNANALGRFKTAREILALKAIGQHTLAEKRMASAYPLASDKTKEALMLTAQELGIATLQLAMAKKNQDQTEGQLNALMYPVPEWASLLNDAQKPLVLAIVRKESGFNAGVRSPRGAAGLMQIMPGTARQMVRDGALEVETSDMSDTLPARAALRQDLHDAEYNLVIGQAYLMHLQDQSYIGDNLIYLLAAYNAGPGTLTQWQKLYSKQDPLLFLESIPYRETRYYVKHVMKNYWVYAAMMHQSPPSLKLMSRGAWPELASAKH